jgi:hypothetical protein
MTALFQPQTFVSFYLTQNDNTNKDAITEMTGKLLPVHTIMTITQLLPA